MWTPPAAVRPLSRLSRLPALAALSAGYSSDAPPEAALGYRSASVSTPSDSAAPEWAENSDPLPLRRIESGPSRGRYAEKPIAVHLSSPLADR